MRTHDDHQLRWIQRRQWFNLGAVLVVGVATLVSSDARSNESQRITSCIQNFADRTANYQTRARRYAAEDRAALIAKEKAQRDALRKPDRTTLGRFVAAQDSYIDTLEKNDAKRAEDPAPDPPSEACP